MVHQCCSVLQLDILWCLSEVAAYPGHQAGVHFNPFKFFLEHNWLDDTESTREVQEKYPDCAAAMDTAGPKAGGLPGSKPVLSSLGLQLCRERTVGRGGGEVCPLCQVRVPVRERDCDEQGVECAAMSCGERSWGRAL